MRTESKLNAKKARLQRYDQQTNETKTRRLWNILSHSDMEAFFSALQRLPTLPWSRTKVWNDVADAMLIGQPAGHTDSIFFVDTETILPDNRPQILEIAILNCQCLTVIQPTTIDYNKSISDLCGGLGHEFLSYAINIYNQNNTVTITHGNHMTHGKTPEDMQTELVRIGLGRPGAHLIEWSESGWDWRALRELCGNDSVPSEYLRGQDLLRMCGYQGPMDLETLFYLCFPTSPLCKKHHRALWDATKLYWLLYCILSRRLLSAEEAALVDV